jgi:hypothetical protein
MEVLIMWKKTLFAGLLAFSAAVPVLAHGGYYDDYVDARVIRVEPQLSFAYSNWGGNDAFRILYEWGGSQYWTYGPRHPGSWVRVRPPRVVHHYYQPSYRYERHHEYRHDWRDDDRRRDGRRDYRGNDRHRR